MHKILIVAAIVIFTFGYAVYHAMKLGDKLSSNQSFLNSNSVLQVLPEVKVPEYFSGELVDLNKMAGDGNNLVVHFWATWCGPCETEFPEIVSLTERVKTKKDVKFLFITVNDDLKDVKKFLKKYKISEEANFLILRDDELFHQRYFGTYKLPETYLFGKDGKLLRKFSGPQKWGDADYIDMVLSM